ncbi:MAG: DUF4783 domain-containing protein [Fulvivirga sp.]|nr:DUF4783 domain-containing protein [Fulvivirga sp.]
MKKSLKYIVLGMIMMFCLPTHAQDDVIDNVKEAIKAGSSKEFAKYFNENIDVTVEGEMKRYSRTQAEYVLRDFFKLHPPSSFTIVHEGSSKGGLPYAIGQYLSKDDTYRVWMRLKNTNNRYLIHEISFIKE